MFGAGIAAGDQIGQRQITVDVVVHLYLATSHQNGATWVRQPHCLRWQSDQAGSACYKVAANQPPTPHGCVKCFFNVFRTKQISPPKKPFWESCEDAQKRSPASLACIDQQWSSIMLATLSIIYREFCKARLAEMRLVAGY
jgi:hypothetical protein